MRIWLFLFGAMLSTALLAAPSGGIDALKAFHSRVDTLAADFTQVQRDQAGDTIQQAEGRFLLARPDRFRWSYETPYRQIIVSDGEAFYFYDVDLSQVTIRAVDASLRATPAQLLAGGAALEDAFELSDAGQRDGLAWVRLKPRGDSSDFREIRIGLDDAVPAQMALDDRLGQTTRIAFEQVKVNSDIADGRFQLDIPDSATVVDGREAPQ